MSLWRRAAKRDSNEADLVQVAEAMGATWQPLSIRGGPDGVLHMHGKAAFVEIKAGKEQLRETQRVFHKKWQGPPIRVVRNSSEMVNVVQSLKQENRKI